jgi:hypothetical protein
MRIACALVATTPVGVAVSMASCAQTPPNVTLHSFQQAQKVDVVCIQVNDANGNAVAPSPVPENKCTPVPSGVNSATLQFHIYAVVTQTTPGALAVVDLTAGNVVDVDRSTPGVDFIPVGATPTDVAVTRDGLFTFVSSADPNKLAIYAIDNTRLLGNSTVGSLPPSDGAPLMQQRPLVLSELRSCALPQPPQALAVLPSDPSDGGSPGAYPLVVLLRAAAGMPAVVATIDPTSMAPGSLSPCSILGATALSGQVAASPTPGPAWPDGVPYAGVGDLRLQEPAPGPQCTLPIADAGAPDDAAGMAVGLGDAGPADAGASDAGANDAASDAANAGPTLQPPHPTSIALRTDTPLLYVADDAVPVIHVIDLHDPSSPREIDPLLATSVAEPSRRVAVGEIAISPATHDYKVFLYAIDARQGTLMVYDVTDPVNSPHVPLERPHPELNPFAPLDRLSFSAPVAAVAFVRHDWSLPSQVDAIHQYTGVLCNPNPNAYPDAGVFVDRGAYYRADQAALIESMVTNGGTVQTLPSRLRGVFGFATLSNGAVVTIDVDDWDAPCRRPDKMATGSITGVLDVPEPDPGPGDLDPYHAPFTNSAPPHTAAVTLEAFFPVSAPHRLRSGFLLRSDSVVGIHMPSLVGVPQLFSATGAPVPTTGVGGATSPVLLPAPLPTGFSDPPSVSTATATAVDGGATSNGGSDGGQDGAPPNADPSHTLPGIRVSFDDPTTHQDQDWAVTYEGALPTVSGIAADIKSTSTDPNVAYQTLTLSAPGAQFCARGVEDWSIGQTRANQVLSEIGRAFAVPPSTVMTNLGSSAPTLPQWTSDYVEISDDLLPASDPYWSEPIETNDCWDRPLADDPGRPRGPDPAGPPPSTLALAQDRYNACQQTFGAAADADTHLLRDLPILQAHDDSLEVGRFGWFPGPVAAADGGSPDAGANTNLTREETTNRVVVPGDPSNVPFLRLTRCCFHHQAAFKVRAGGQWLAIGSSVGLLHHVKADATGACVLSCEPRTTLLNARAFDIPWWSSDSTKGVCSAVAAPSFDRDSPLAMRNPMFSFVMWAGCPGSTPPTHDHTLSTRDLAWRFSMRGGFVPLTVQLTSPTTGNAVSPQSMRFIGSLGQLAVVDGESQGLVLIDLNLLAVVHNYF